MPFHNTQTLQFKAQALNVFFATVNQMSSSSSQLSATARHCFVIWTVLNNLIMARSAVVRSWEASSNIWLTIAKNSFVGQALNFRVCKIDNSGSWLSLYNDITEFDGITFLLTIVCLTMCTSLISWKLALMDQEPVNSIGTLLSLMQSLTEWICVPYIHASLDESGLA